MSVVTRYRIDATIGIGPDGPVRRAMAERLGARPVAIRDARVPVGPARAALRHRAELLARVGHPALAVVVDLVDVDDEQVQVVSELGEHGSLHDRLLLGPLPVSEAAGVAATLAEALAAAASLGLRHGHPGPTNVVFGDRGAMLTDLVLHPVAGEDGDMDRRRFGGLVAGLAGDGPGATPHHRELVALGHQLEGGELASFAASVGPLTDLARRARASSAPSASAASLGWAARSGGASETSPRPCDPRRPSASSSGVVVAGAAVLGVTIGALSTALPL